MLKINTSTIPSQIKNVSLQKADNFPYEREEKNDFATNNDPGSNFTQTIKLRLTMSPID